MSRISELQNELPSAVGAAMAPVTRPTDTSSMQSVQRVDILIATDGSSDADGAVRVGVALSQRDGTKVEFLSIVEPVPVYDTGGIIPTDAASHTPLLCQGRQEEVRAQRDRTFPAASDWLVRIEVGDRTEKIAAAGDRKQTGMIVLGLGEHGITARVLARETSLRVIRAATVPVLAVPKDAWGVPRSALAALDFTASSNQAARTALALLAGEGTLYLAHVSPRVQIPQGDSRTWEEQTSDTTRELMRALELQLNAPAGVKIKHVSLHGDPATELLAFAEEFDVQLIAAGTHGRSAIGRLLMGSVSTQLVRQARSWVLVAPPAVDTDSVVG